MHEGHSLATTGFTRPGIPGIHRTMKIWDAAVETKMEPMLVNTPDISSWEE